MAKPSGRYGLFLRLQVGQSERTTLDRFHDAVGGLGKVYGPHDPNAYHDGFQRKSRFRYQVSGSDAERVLDALWPYLSEPKRRQAETAKNALRASAA